MQLFYDEIGVQDLGTLFISAQETHGEPEEAPQRLPARILAAGEFDGGHPQLDRTAGKFSQGTAA